MASPTFIQVDVVDLVRNVRVNETVHDATKEEEKSTDEVNHNNAFMTILEMGTEKKRKF